MYLNNLTDEEMLEECETISYCCCLKIEPPGPEHFLHTYSMGLTDPLYVLKSRNPTYDMKTFYDIEQMYEYLIAYKKEFDKRNKRTYNRKIAEIGENRYA